MKQVYIVLLLLISWVSIEAKKIAFTMPATNKVLIFSPHPDDDIIGCGGAIISHVKSGNHVKIIYMTSGEAAEWKGKPHELAALREEEARRGAEKLHVKDLIFLRQSDSKLAKSKAATQIIKQILIDELPDIIYVPNRYERHIDHAATYEFVIKAIKELPTSQRLPIIMLYEVWTPLTDVTHGIKMTDDFMKLKLTALTEHKSQIELVNFGKAIEGLHIYRGIMNGCEKLECFLELKL